MHIYVKYSSQEYSQTLAGGYSIVIIVPYPLSDPPPPPHCLKKCKFVHIVAHDVIPERTQDIIV